MICLKDLELFNKRYVGICHLLSQDYFDMARYLSYKSKGVTLAKRLSFAQRIGYQSKTRQFGSLKNLNNVVRPALLQTQQNNSSKLGENMGLSCSFDKTNATPR